MKYESLLESHTGLERNTGKYKSKKEILQLFPSETYTRKTIFAYCNHKDPNAYLLPLIKPNLYRHINEKNMSNNVWNVYKCVK